MNYMVCYPAAVGEFSVNKSFLMFVVKSNASESFAEVNNLVKKVCNSIDGIKSDLTTLKKKMGVNDEMNSQIDKVINGLDQKKADVIKKNTELFQSIDQVISYIAENKTSKVEEAGRIRQGIDIIDVYKG